MPKLYPGDGVEVIGQDVTVPNLITAGNVDGRDVSADGTKLDTIAENADVTGSNAPEAHKDLHDPEDGGDPVDTAAPVQVGSANAIGNSHSLARANHVHQREHAIYTDSSARAAAVSDTVYGAGWNGVTTIAPSKNAVYDKIEALGGASLTVSETEVFSGTSPTSWTDLDLSGTVGSNYALVVLKVVNTNTNLRGIQFRRNGDTDDSSRSDPLNGTGAASAYGYQNVFEVLIIPTDSAGKVEWITPYFAESSTTIDIIAYIK